MPTMKLPNIDDVVAVDIHTHHAPTRHHADAAIPVG